MPVTVKVFILALIQGLTELLPVSSSGHLVLAKHLLHLNSPGISLEVALHLGTLLAVLVYYRRRIAFLIVDFLKWGPEGPRYALAILIGSIPAGVVGVLFKDSIERLGDEPRWAAAGMIVTGLLLLSLLLARGLERPLGTFRAFWIGLAQMVGIPPGISRSGTTIVMARHLGIAPAAAAEFSFLLSIPAIAGASVLELLHHGAWTPGEVSLSSLLMGIAVAALVGYFSLVLLVGVLARGRFWMFGLYCLPVGAIGFWLLT